MHFVHCFIKNTLYSYFSNGFVEMKKRLDLVLNEKGFFSSRSKAQIHILSGEVFVNKEKVTTPSRLVPEDSDIEIKLLKDSFVGRGGIKLEEALEHYKVDVNNLDCIDIGASTGGFTHCLLKRNINKIFCVDVGYGQLDFKLRNNSKVTNLERTNARYLTKDIIGQDIDLIVMDVSFISITKFKSFFSEFVNKDNSFVGLIKPQFELTPQKIGKNGIVTDSDFRNEAVLSVTSFLEDFYLNVLPPIESPIKGSKGNIEYLVYAKN